MDRKFYSSIVMTADINSKIISIIQNASNYCYIISPSISLWPLLEREFEKSSILHKSLTVITRPSDDAAKKELFAMLVEKYKVNVLLLQNLHFSLCFNENESLFSSMSVHDNSQENTFEIGSYFFKPTLSSRLKSKIVEDELLRFSVKLRTSMIKSNPAVEEFSHIAGSEMQVINARTSDLDMDYDNNADEDDSPIEIPW